MNDTPCLEMCWEKLCRIYPAETRDQVVARWKTICADSNPHNDYGEFNAEDWAKVDRILTSLQPANAVNATERAAVRGAVAGGRDTNAPARVEGNETTGRGR